MYKPISLKDVRAYCLTCDQPAKVVAMVDDPAVALEKKLVVACHGIVDRVVVPDAVLMDGIVVDVFRPASKGAAA